MRIRWMVRISSMMRSKMRFTRVRRQRAARCDRVTLRNTWSSRLRLVDGQLGARASRGRSLPPRACARSAARQCADPARRSSTRYSSSCAQRFFARHACAPSKPCFSSRTNASSWISSDALSRFCSIRRTMALPTTTASTWRAQFRHLLRLRDAEAHRQRQIGDGAHGARPAARRHRRATRARRSRRCARPGRRSRWNIAPPASAAARVLVGAARNTVSRSVAAHGVDVLARFFHAERR